MGDADDSYDFLEIPKFITELREGRTTLSKAADCRAVVDASCRARCRSSTAGSVTPFLSWLVRFMFRIPIHDVYCGMRGFTQNTLRSVWICAAPEWSLRRR